MEGIPSSVDPPLDMMDILRGSPLAALKVLLKWTKSMTGACMWQTAKKQLRSCRESEPAMTRSLMRTSAPLNSVSARMRTVDELMRSIDDGCLDALAEGCTVQDAGLLDAFARAAGTWISA